MVVLKDDNSKGNIDDLPMDGRKASNVLRDGKQTLADRQLLLKPVCISIDLRQQLDANSSVLTF